MRAGTLKIFIFIACVYSSSCIAQLVLNNGVIINVNGGTSNAASSNIVLNTPPAIPIKQVGTTTSQGIILESEWNRVQYNLSNGTTAITVPYITNATGTFVPFPLTVNSITAGTNSAGKTGAIRFSSRHAGTLATGWDNTGYMPSDVLNMNGAACAGNNSANAIDRFWIIEPVYYSTRPAVTLNFTYLMSEADVNGGNTASLYTTLQPQRYDTTVAAACAWNGFPTTAAEYGTSTPGACCGNNTGTVSGVQVSAAQFFPDWTLANYLVPLPLEARDFSAICNNKNVTLNWNSNQETAGSNYVIEKSADAVNFTFLVSIPILSNSSHNASHTYTDISSGNGSTAYYRLYESDQTGKKSADKIVSVTNCNSSTESGTIYSHNGDVTIDLNSLSNQNITVTAFDVTGRLIYENRFFASEGHNTVKFTPEISQGIYLFELKTERLSVVKRILIQH